MPWGRATLEMFPSFSIYNATNCGLINTKALCYLRLCVLTAHSEALDGQDVLCGKFGTPVSFARRSINT